MISASRIKEILRRFKLAKDLQKIDQVDVVRMGFTEYELKEVIYILGGLLILLNEKGESGL